MFVLKRNKDFTRLSVELRSDVLLVLRSAAAERRLSLDAYISDLLHDAAKKEALLKLKGPVSR